MSHSTGKPYVRLARPEEFDQIIELGTKAFVGDPVLSYFANLKEPSQTTDPLTYKALGSYINFVLRSSYLVGGRITVVASPDPQEKVLAAAIWLPPKRRVSPWNILVLLWTGIISVFLGWGLIGSIRFLVEFPWARAASWKRGYKAEEVRQPTDASWYLRLAMSHPDHQKHGFMTMLVKEGFELSPKSIFVLEATNIKARDHFVHMGFELLDRTALGHGNVGSSGLPTTGKAATGVEFYSMVNWHSANVIRSK